MDTGLLILRVVVGLLIAGHGAQKVSYRFGGHGLVGGTEEFRHDGFRGGPLTALAAGVGQVCSGLFLALGALTPLAAMVAMGVMTVALTVKLPHGLWVQDDGYEYPLVLVVVAGALIFTGPGRWSADHAVGLTAWPVWLSVVAVVLGLSSGLLTRAVLHRAPAPEEGASVARPAD
ncbi:DoxX family protein [Streptomyces platensis]|uniref:DoxX family protein n=1 Tax=Streptomyces platensis TaxID=58346 RepID=UPI003676DB57